MFEFTYARPRFGFDDRSGCAVVIGPDAADHAHDAGPEIASPPAPVEIVVDNPETPEIEAAESVLELEPLPDEPTSVSADAEPEAAPIPVATVTTEPPPADVAAAPELIAEADLPVVKRTRSRKRPAARSTPRRRNATSQKPIADEPVAETVIEPEAEPVAAAPEPEIEPPPQYNLPAVRSLPDSSPGDLRFPLEMRALERRLERLWLSTACPIIGVVGASPGAGASTVSLAFARHLAGRGKRVLLCGETARVREVLPVPRPQNLPIDLISLPYLTVINLTDIFRPTEDDGAALKLERWLSSLKPRFDLMLLDLAAPTRSPDTGSLLALANGAVVVVRAESSRTSEVDETVDAVLEAGAEPLGFVFNGRAREPRRFGRERQAA